MPTAHASHTGRSVIGGAIVFLVFALIGFAEHAVAAVEGFAALAPIPGLTDESATAVVNSATLANFFNNLYKYLIGLAATLAVIQIVWAGLDIAFWHKDAVSTIIDDKGKIYNALFGLVLVLSPVLVFSIINPSILNLSLNLPPLDTKSVVTPTSVTDTSTPVTVVGGTTVTDSRISACTTSNCSAEKAACIKDKPTDLPSDYEAYAGVVCVRSNGTVDLNGQTAGSLLNPFSGYECIAGETLSISCRYAQTSPF